MIQQIFIWTLFGLAIYFVARRIYMDFSSKNNCPKGCGGCDIADSKPIHMSSSIKSIK